MAEELPSVREEADTDQSVVQPDCTEDVNPVKVISGEMVLCCSQHCAMVAATKENYWAQQVLFTLGRVSNLDRLFVIQVEAIIRLINDCLSGVCDTLLRERMLWDPGGLATQL